MYFFSDVQAQKIIAIVLDDKGIPIPYATVFNSKTNLGVITNEEGKFKLNAEPNDNIIINCLGYQEYISVAEQLQNIGIAVLKEKIFNINEVIITPYSIDLISIVKKFRARIQQNYPKHPIVINGIYKEYALVENEYYGFIQCNLDIFINSISSFSRPTIKTRVHDYLLFRNSNRDNTEMIVTEDHLKSFWLFGYSFLWNFKEYQHSIMGYIIYNGSRLIKIKIYPKKIDNYETQIEGIMYIDLKSYALIYLQYELLPNKKDFSEFKGRWQKPVKGETKIMFEFINGYFYPVYVISNQTSRGIVSDWEIKPNNKDTINIDFVYNFFSKNVEYKPKSFYVDGYSFDDLFRKAENTIFDQSKDYKSDFILETEQEKRLLQPYKEKK